MVIDKAGQTKVAQYGQWDGDPSGQGAKALSCLHNFDLDKLNVKLSTISFFSTDDLVTLDLNSWEDEYPWISRDLGAKVLDAIYSGQFEVGYTLLRNKRMIECEVNKLVNDEVFARDSSFCEWCYVIDLSKGTFEVYKGFNVTPLVKSDRFYHLQNPGKEYYPVKLVKDYQLDSLPTVAEFLNDLNQN